MPESIAYTWGCLLAKIKDWIESPETFAKGFYDELNHKLKKEKFQFLMRVRQKENKVIHTK